MASGLGELVPDVEPVTVLLVDALATDLDFNVLDQDVANPVEPAESLASGDGNIGQLDAKVHAVDQITVAADGAGDLLAEVSGTIDTLSQRFP